MAEYAGAIAGGIESYFALGRQQKVLAEQQESVRAEAKSKSAAIARRGRIIQAQAIAAAGAGGGMGQGSDLDVLIENAKNIAYDQAQAIHEGALQAWSLNEQEKSTKWARNMTLYTGFAPAMGAGAQSLAGDAKTWFTNSKGIGEVGSTVEGKWIEGGPAYSGAGGGWGGAAGAGAL